MDEVAFLAEAGLGRVVQDLHLLAEQVLEVETGLALMGPRSRGATGVLLEDPAALQSQFLLEIDQVLQRLLDRDVVADGAAHHRPTALGHVGGQADHKVDDRLLGPLQPLHRGVQLLEGVGVAGGVEVAAEDEDALEQVEPGGGEQDGVDDETGEWDGLDADEEGDEPDDHHDGLQGEHALERRA